MFLHPGCNMTCKFCITENAFSSMTFEQAVSLLKFLKEESISNVVFGGGEPFSWGHDLLKLAKEAKEMGFFVQVGTNGIALPNGFEFVESIDRYVLPLDSMDENKHNYLRRYKNRHHSIVIDRLEELKLAKKSVTISTVVTRQNLNQLKEIGLFLKEYNQGFHQLHAWHLYQFMPEGREGRLNAPLLSIRSEDYHESCNELKQMDLGFMIYKRTDMYRSKSVDFFWYLGSELKIGSQVFSIPNPANSLPRVA